MNHPELVKKALQQLGITQRELASLLGVHYTTVYRWVHGVDKTDSVLHIALLKEFSVSQIKFDTNVSVLIVSKGVIEAIYQILDHNFKRKGKL